MEWGGDDRTKRGDLLVLGTIRSAPWSMISEPLEISSGESCSPGELVLGPPSGYAGIQLTRAFPFKMGSTSQFLLERLAIALPLCFRVCRGHGRNVADTKDLLSLVSVLPMTQEVHGPQNPRCPSDEGRACKIQNQQ